MSPIVYIGIGIVLLFIIGVGIAYFSGSRDVSIDDRLEEFVGDTGTAFIDADFEEEASSYLQNKDGVADRVDEVLAGGKRFDKIRDKIAKADKKLRVSEYILIQLGSGVAVGAGLFAFFGFNQIAFFIGLPIGLLIPGIYLSIAASSRLRAFDDQLSDTLNLWVNALRSGYSVLQGMEAIATELGPPMSTEFERVVQEVRLGLSLSQALNNMLRRIPSEDLDLVVTAVNIQREVGGNLAEILAVISFTIRERVRIKGEIRTLTAQGRISGWVVGLLPIGLGFILLKLNPEYMGQLWMKEDPFVIEPWFPCGYCVIGLGLAMTGAGMVAIQKIMDIEV